jgi:S-adenosylmethionine/arginine decarboxylase-like enzyme
MNKNFLGKSVSIDLSGCNDSIKEPWKIIDFCIKLCEVIDMKRFGPIHLQRFGMGKLEGYSFMQFIETSSVTAHFDEKNTPTQAFIDIFSCKDFNEKNALKFCREFFEAKKYRMKILIRR